jgi:hypothetical protein
MKRFLTYFLFFAVRLFSQNVNLSEGELFDGEPYIAVNPTNAQNMVVAWMSMLPNGKIYVKTRNSFDGGKTWQSTVTLANAFPQATAADVSLAFNEQGEVFLSFINSNHRLDEGGVYIRKSTDGGTIWSDPVEAININADSGKFPIDRPWLCVDKSDGVFNGRIYLTTVNAKAAGNVSPPFHPYFVCSDDGEAFGELRYLDAPNFWAGNVIRSPMPTPTVASDGKFHAVYSSYVPSQNIFPRYILAKSSDGGDTFEYFPVYAQTHIVSDTLAKKGYLLRSDPSNAEHLAFVFLDEKFGDADVNFTESFDGGETWSEPKRINDDEQGNGVMQDLIWADFDNDGDFAITWRDRRNGDGSGYASDYEIYGSVRLNGASDFSSDFIISDTLLPYDPLLDRNGNDFMCVDFNNDTLNVVWGDMRNGKMNIWFQRVAVEDVVSVIPNDNSLENPNKFALNRNYPNPFNLTTIISYSISNVCVNTKNSAAQGIRHAVDVTLDVYNALGQKVATLVNKEQTAGNYSVLFDAGDLPSGIYFYTLHAYDFTATKKMLLIK